MTNNERAEMHAQEAAKLIEQTMSKHKTNMQSGACAAAHASLAIYYQQKGG